MTTTSVVRVSTGDCDNDRPLRAFALIIRSFRAGEKFSNISAWTELHASESVARVPSGETHTGRLKAEQKVSSDKLVRT